MDNSVSGPGIIPAYAGSTPATSPKPRGTRDHPRVCGEHSEFEVDKISFKGSSPRMRGAHGITWHNFIFCGIIPAYAGSTD